MTANTTILRAEYACCARFSFGGTDYAVATDTKYRVGVWHDGVMLVDAPLAQVFSDGITTGDRVALAIADGIDGIYRTLVANNDLAGTLATVETICTVHYADGTSAEQVAAQILTITDTSLEPERVTLTLVNIDDDKLAALYPSAKYSTTDFPSLEPEGSGRPIAFPVGTALKLTCTLLEKRTVAYSAASTSLPLWLYGVCELDWTSLAIVAANIGSKYFEVAGNQTAYFNQGDSIWVFDPANSHTQTNVGKYTVVNAVYNIITAGRTTIFTNEAPTSTTVACSVNVPPRVLSVYRNGRLVASTEYTIEVLDNLPADFRAGVGDMSTAGEWTMSSVGTGTGTLASGVMTLTGDGTASNYGAARHQPASPDNSGQLWRRHHYVALKADLTGSGAKVWAQIGTLVSLLPDSAVLLNAASAQIFLVKVSTALDDRRIAFTGNASGFSGSAVIDNLSVLKPTKPILLIRFTAEQLDFDGSPYVIEADVYGYRSRNAVDEINRLLTAAGATPDTSTFAAAATYATTNYMLVDCDHGSSYGNEAGQRPIRAIVDDLLFIARASLYRTDAGWYAIAQDIAGSSVATLVEDYGDEVQVLGIDRPQRPSSVGIRYRPSARDPSELQHTVTRTVSGGTMAAETPQDVRYLRDHINADHLLSYLAARRQYSRRLRLRQWRASRSIGEVITVKSSPTSPNTQDWTVWAARQIPAGVEVDGREYNAAVHSYVAGTLPTDAQTQYSPDYSQTAPAAPTALKITAGSTALAGDGTLTARVTVEAVPPSVNWAELWFYVVRNVTGEIAALVLGADIGSGKRGTTLSSLRPGEVYQLKACAKNSFNVLGTVLGTFDATAIGGGGAATTFTAPGYATLPANVASCTATQRMGRIIEIAWPAVTTVNLWGYVLECSIGGGGYAEIWRGQATSYRDTSVAIGTAYQYRVKARDSYGNLSASYATSGSVTPAANIVGGSSGNDIPATTISTFNRTGVTTISASYNTLGALTVVYAVSHSLGVLPIVASVASNDGQVPATLQYTSTTQVFAMLSAPWNVTGNNSIAGDPHTHTGVVPTFTGTVSMDVW